MKLATQVGISVVALGVIGVAAYLGTALAIGRAVAALERFSKIGNSPIMASGGSMTFRADGGWNCDTTSNLHQECVSTSQVSVGTIAWDNVIPNYDDNLRTLGWTGLSKAWSLDIRARDNPNRGGVLMCTTSTNTFSGSTSPACDAATVTYGANSKTYILIMIEGSSATSGGTLALMDSSAAESGTSAEQYYDSGCLIHDPSKVSMIPRCEHPGNITSSIDKNVYKCQHGNCQIAIDK